jgi:hypothetical protein
MGVDYELAAHGADLYLDRGYPFREGRWNDGVNLDLPLTGDMVRLLDDCERYGPGWVEAVARWLDEHGPAWLIPDTGSFMPAGVPDGGERWEAWKRNERRRFDLARAPGGPWSTFERRR